MARLYRISADTSEKEKAVGGILTFGQAGWLDLGLIVFAAVFIGLSRVIPAVLAGIIALAPGLGIALPFAFFKKGELTLTQYLKWRFLFQRKNRYMINTLTYRLDRPNDFAREQKLKEVDFSA